MRGWCRKIQPHRRYAPVEMLAPLGGVTLMLNIWVAPMLNDEKVYPIDVAVSSLIIFGIAVTVLSVCRLPAPVCGCRALCASVCLCVSVSLRLCVPVSLCLCVPVFLCLFVSVPLSVCLSVCLSVSLSLSLSLSLPERPTRRSRLRGSRRSTPPSCTITSFAGTTSCTRR
jgi:hypothetical protein